MAGIPDAEHEESAPNAPTLLVSRLAGSLVGKTQTIRMTPGSVLQRAYGSEQADEQFACNYGLNPMFGPVFNTGLRVTGMDAEGNARAVELSEHPFYVATLYLPQVRSAPGRPHPLVLAFVRAALSYGSSGRNSS